MNKFERSDKTCSVTHQPVTVTFTLRGCASSRSFLCESSIHVSLKKEAVKPEFSVEKSGFYDCESDITNIYRKNPTSAIIAVLDTINLNEVSYGN
ncbi:MAG: hypothetical protein VKN72_28840 [Nostocales cyanobacterium 94392]|nr:hypothetical protein [Nostocales cyanobacterium 94392]